MRQLIDITIPLGPGTPLYPGDPVPVAELSSDIARGDALTASTLALGAHVGTHVDLPGHFIAGGRLLGDYAIDSFVGPAWVLDLPDVEAAIDADRLAVETIPSARHLLLKTNNSRLLGEPGFRDDYVHLSEAATRRLLASDPLSIGIDYYSLDPADSDTFASHRLCAEAGIPVFVCLDLGRVGAGDWRFAGLPLAMPSLEGAPVRAIVWRD